MPAVRSFASADVAAGHALPPSPEQEAAILREMVLRLPNAVAYVDADDKLRLANDAYTTLMGTSRDDVADLRSAGERLRWQFETGRQPLTHATVEASVAAALARQAAGDGTPALRYFLGRTYEHRFIALPEGRTMTVYQDITTLKQQEDELRATLDYVSAINDVLKIISRSAFDLTAVLQTVVSKAAELCGAERAILYRYTDGACRFEVGHNIPPGYEQVERGHPLVAGTGTVVGRALLDRRTVQISDTLADPDYAAKEQARAGSVRSLLGVPLLREGEPVGVMALARSNTTPFTAAQIDMVTTFADQAAIAIENARLLTELRDARRDAERERAMMRAILDNVTDGMGLFDANGDIALWNDAMYAINGFPRDVFTHFHNVREVLRWQVDNGHLPLSDASPEAAAAALVAAFFDGNPHQTTVQRPNGRWVEVRWDRLPDGRRLFTHRDVTALKHEELRAQDALIAAEQARATMQVLLENMTDGVTLCEPDGTVIQCTDAVYEINGIPRVEWELRHISDGMRFLLRDEQLKNPDFDVEAAVARQMSSFLTGDVHRPAALRPNGRWVERQWRNLDDGRRLVIHRDVTELKERELELQQARDATEQTRVLMETVLDNMTDGVILWDEAGEWRYANKALCDIQQVSRDRLAELRRYEAMARARREQNALDDAAFEWAIERYRLANGATDLRETSDGRWVEGALHRLTNGSTLGVYRDVTALKKQEIALIERSNDLQEAVEFQSAVGDVLRVISRSAFDLEALLTTVLNRAVALCEADAAIIYRYQDGACRFGIGLGMSPAYHERERSLVILPGTGTVVGRAILEGRTVHIADAWNEPGYEPIDDAKLGNVRSMLGVPLIRAGVPIGVIALARTRVAPYSDRHIERVSTFGDQAAIAMESARLFEEQQAAQSEIERERALMRAILDNVTDGMGLFEANGDIALWNDAMYEINGFPKEIFRGFRNVEQAFRWQAENDQFYGGQTNPDPIVRDVMGRFLRGDPYRRTAQRPNGRWVDVRWTVLPDGRRLFAHRDVTDLKDRELQLQAATEALEQEGEKLAAILDNLPDGVALFAANGDLLHLNPAGYEINQFPTEPHARLKTMRDGLRWQLQNGVHPLTQPSLEAELDAHMAVFLSGKPHSGQFNRFGRWVDVQWLPLPDGRRLVVNRDVTSLKERELELREARDVTERTRTLMETVLENMTDGLILWDPDGEWRYANKAFCDIQQSSPERLAMLRRFDTMMDALLERGLIDEAFRTAAVARFDRADGEPKLRATHDGRWAEGAFHRLGDGSTLGVFRDITALKVQELRLAEERDAAEIARKEAEAANQSKSTFLATMSHEIRTPMNGVLGMMEVLDHQDLTDAQRGTVSVMRESAVSLLRIIDDVLDFSKIEAGRMELEETAFSLSDIVTGTIRAMRAPAVAKSIRLAAELDPGSADALVGDPTRVRQILVNLLGNAVKFTDRGAIHVRAGTAPIGNGAQRVSLSVTDTGIGMDRTQMARLFQPFAQGDSSTTRQFGGTGLGLSIVRRLAQLMGGDVTVTSEPGEGSVFTVTLVLRAAADVPSILEAGPSLTRLSAGAGLLLVVDDHPVNREVLVRQLALLGLSADTAEDGEVALQLWEPGRYAAVLADMHMPRLDGYGLTAAIRRQERALGAARTPIVAVTANAMRGEEERCLASGMDAYIAKPVGLNRLRDTLLRWMTVATREKPAVTPLGIGIDREKLRDWMGDDPEVIDALLRRFVESAHESVADIEQGIAAGGTVQIAAAAHRLKGASLAVGAEGLGDVASRLESLAKAGQLALCADTLAHLRREMQAVARSL